MFIRWKKRQLKEKDRSEPIGWYWSRDKQMNEAIGSHQMPIHGWKDTDDYSLSAYLVESYRNEEGKPRQRNIAYLGTARVKAAEEGKPLHGYWWIWDNFYKAMDVHDVDPATAATLSTKIEDKIGVRMTPDDVTKIKKERDAFFEATKKLFSRP